MRLFILEGGIDSVFNFPFALTYFDDVYILVLWRVDKHIRLIEYTFCPKKVAAMHVNLHQTTILTLNSNVNESFEFPDLNLVLEFLDCFSMDVLQLAFSRASPISSNWDTGLGRSTRVSMAIPLFISFSYHLVGVRSSASYMCGETSDTRIT